MNVQADRIATGLELRVAQVQVEVAAPKSEFEHLVWPYRLMVPFLFAIGAWVQVKNVLFHLLFSARPRTSFWAVDGISINSRRVKEGARRWPALDVCYNFVTGEGPNAIVRAIDSYWLHIRNAQAVRNRLKIAKRELRKAIETLVSSGRDEPIRILSLAAGAAQGVIEVATDLWRQRGINVEILLIDSDLTALQHARKLARDAGIEDRLSAKVGNVLHFSTMLGGFKPDIVEMLGMIDYLPDTTIVLMTKKIRHLLSIDGYFLTCHIHPNAERYFLKHVEHWGMRYRSRSKLRDLVEKGGFLGPELYTEPHRIHTVAVARKID